MIKRGSLQTKSVKLLILDESNEMLSNGFEKPHLRCLQIRCSDLFYFCYFPQKILELTNKFIMDPERKLVKRDELTLEGIKQYYIDVGEEEWKFFFFFFAKRRMEV